jgi:aryl-alcohol dehydrogenase-like predicted oxidoreductase
MTMDLTSYRTLGRSGLVVSPMALGAMTFGKERWGIDQAGAGAIMDFYIEAGGNFIDTAEAYADGRSEEIVGRYIAERGLRDRMVLATKFSWNRDKGNPNAGGNGRKNIHRAVEGSLKRLGTDYIDLYWLHFWDMVTPVEEVLDSLVDLVRAGKIRYFALSDVPAWYMTKMAVIARERGVPGPIALQLEYSLVERTIENEHIPSAVDQGIAVMPWSPLAGGFLSGKYRRSDESTGGFSGDGRLARDNPFGSSKFIERNWALLDVLEQVATAMEHSPAEVALAWLLRRPGVTSTITGASRPEQLGTNLSALGIDITDEHADRLEKASAPVPVFPYAAFNATVNRTIFGGTSVTGWTGQSVIS